AAPVSKKFLWHMLAVFIAAGILLGPWLIAAYGEKNKQAIAENPILLEASIPHRLEIWNFVAGNIEKRPLTGWGIEATRHMESPTVMEFMNATNVLHPH